MAKAPATELGRALTRAFADLQELGQRAALVGGLAVSSLAEPRLTRDIDIALAVADDRAAEGVVHGLQQLGYTLFELLEHEAANRIATARLMAPGAEGVVVDLLFASSGVEAEVVAESQKLEVLPGVEVPVARVGHLMALKTLARDDRKRPQDFDDLRSLLAVAPAEERHRAEKALRLIAKRGFNRRRDLAESWKRILRELGPTSPRR